MIKLRQAKLADHASITTLHTASWRRTYRGIFTDHYLDKEAEEDLSATWRERILSPLDTQFITVAERDGRLVGFSCTFLNDDNVFGSLIDNLHVAADMHRLGVGRMLITEVARQILSKAENKRMYLWVYEANSNARTFYEKLGGEQIETVATTNPDGGNSKSCRIYWEDASTLLPHT